MRKMNQGAFTVVEVTLIIIALGIFGFGGYYVYNQNKDDSTNTNVESSASEEIDDVEEEDSEESTSSRFDSSSWTLFESTANWTMRVPDGWNVVSGDGRGFWSAETPEYTEGVPAIITIVDGGRGGPFAINTGYYTNGDPALEEIPALFTEQSDFKSTQVTGKRYSKTLTEDQPMTGAKGDTLYWYVMKGDTSTVVIQYTHFVNAENILDQVEAAGATIEIE